MQRDPLDRSKPLKILYFGAANNTLVRSRILPFTRRARVTWVTTESPPASFLARDLDLIQLPRPWTRALPALRTLNVLASSWSTLLRRVRPDIIHLHYLEPLFALAALPALRTPTVITVMGADVLPDQVHRPPPLDALVRLALRRAHAITTKSQFLADACIQLGAHPDRTVHVPWGVDPERFSPQPAAPARRALGLPPTDTILLSPRSLHPLYNHRPLLDAIAATQLPIHLVSTSHLADPDHLRDLRRHADQLGIRWTILPPQPPDLMPRLFAAADLVATLPASDGLPQTVLEALACLRPCLSLDLAAYRELPFAHHAFARVPHTHGAPDPSALAHTLRHTLTTPQPHPDLHQARAWVLQHANAHRSVERVWELYDTLRR